MKEISGSETRISDGGTQGLAVVSGEPGEMKAVGKYVITRMEEGNEFSKGGIVIPGSTNKKFVVVSVGSDVSLDVEEGDTLIVATMTEIPIWNPELGQEEKFSVYNQEQIMGVIKRR